MVFGSWGREPKLCFDENVGSLEQENAKHQKTKLTCRKIIFLAIKRRLSTQINDRHASSPSTRSFISRLIAKLLWISPNRVHKKLYFIKDTKRNFRLSFSPSCLRPGFEAPLIDKQILQNLH